MATHIINGVFHFRMEDENLLSREMNRSVIFLMNTINKIYEKVPKILSDSSLDERGKADTIKALFELHKGDHPYISGVVKQMEEELLGFVHRDEGNFIFGYKLNDIEVAFSEQ